MQQAFERFRYKRKAISFLFSSIVLQVIVSYVKFLSLFIFCFGFGWFSIRWVSFYLVSQFALHILQAQIRIKSPMDGKMNVYYFLYTWNSVRWCFFCFHLNFLFMVSKSFSPRLVTAANFWSIYKNESQQNKNTNSRKKYVKKCQHHQWTEQRISMMASKLWCNVVEWDQYTAHV